MGSSLLEAGLLHSDLMLLADLLEQVGAGHLPFLCAADLPQAVDFLLDRLDQARGRGGRGACQPADSLELAAAEFVAVARRGGLASPQLGGQFCQLALALLLRVQSTIWLRGDRGEEISCLPVATSGAPRGENYPPLFYDFG